MPTKQCGSIDRMIDIQENAENATHHLIALLVGSIDQSISSRSIDDESSLLAWLVKKIKERAASHGGLRGWAIR